MQDRNVILIKTSILNTFEAISKFTSCIYHNTSNIFLVIQFYIIWKDISIHTQWLTYFQLRIYYWHCEGNNMECQKTKPGQTYARHLTCCIIALALYNFLLVYLIFEATPSSAPVISWLCTQKILVVGLGDHMGSPRQIPGL